MEQFVFTDTRHIYIKFGRTEMPQTIGGVTRAIGNDDNYRMLINSALSEKRQALAFLHEALHIYHNDAADSRPDEEIEAERKTELRELFELLLEEDAAKA